MVNGRVILNDDFLIANTRRTADVGTKSGNALVAQRLVKMLCLRLANPGLQTNRSVAEPDGVALQLSEDTPGNALAASSRRDIHSLDLGCVFVNPTQRTATDGLAIKARYEKSRP